MDTQEEAKIIKELKTEIAELKVEISMKELKQKLLASQNKILVLTAKLKQKDALIADLKRQIGSMTSKKRDKAIQRHIAQSNSSGRTSRWGGDDERSRSMDRHRDRQRSYESMETRRHTCSRRYHSTRDKLDQERSHEITRRSKHREARQSPERSPVRSRQSARVSTWHEKNNTHTNSESRLSPKSIARDTLYNTSNLELWDAELPVTIGENHIQSNEIGTAVLPESPKTPMLVNELLAVPIMDQVPGVSCEQEPRRSMDRELEILNSDIERAGSSERVLELEEGETAFSGDEILSSDVQNSKRHLHKPESDHEKSIESKETEAFEDAPHSNSNGKRSENDGEHDFPTVDTSALSQYIRDRIALTISSNIGKPEQESLKLVEVPPKETNAKSRHEKLKTLFGSDDDDCDDCVFLGTCKRKLSVSVEESIVGKIQNDHSYGSNAESTTSINVEWLESAFDYPQHSTPLAKLASEEDDSLGCSLLKESNSDDLASTAHQDQSLANAASCNEIAIKSLQQTLNEKSPDQISSEALQRDQILTSTSSANTSSLIPSHAPAFQVNASADATHQLKNPEAAVFSNRYSEYRVEDNNDVETTFYIRRKKKKKGKYGCATSSA